MLFQNLWTRNLYNKPNPTATVIEDDHIYVVERLIYLTKINIFTGKIIWSVKLDASNNQIHQHIRWGNLSHFGSKLYFLFQYSKTQIISKEDGATINIIWLENNDNFVPSEDLLIVGTPESPSGLKAYDAHSLNFLWSNIIPFTKGGYTYTRPYFLNKNFIFTANYKFHLCEIIDSYTGKVIRQLKLPEELKHTWVYRTYQIINGRVTFVSESGKLYILSNDYMYFKCKQLNIKNIHSTLPFFYKNIMLFQDVNHYLNLYDFNQHKIIWTEKMADALSLEINACPLTPDTFVFASPSGTFKVITTSGEKIFEKRLEKRVTTKLFSVTNLLAYGTKGEFKALEWSL